MLRLTSQVVRFRGTLTPEPLKFCNLVKRSGHSSEPVMASPRTVRFAMTASVATTGAAAYYFLSEGGSPEKLDSNLRNTWANINDTVAAARSLSEATVGSLKATDTAVPAKKEDDIMPGEKSSGAESLERKKNPPTEQQQWQTGAYCHTCSGPRIWFFAEKLRLKRRITPYPDPPRD